MSSSLKVARAVFNPFLSVVVPFFNEEQNVAFVIKELQGVLIKAGLKHEILAVDDGSSDGTFRKLTELKSEVKTLKAIKLKTNYGQTKAMKAGIEQASGDWILTMDGDGQNDPNSLSTLLEKAALGFDVVSGWRKNRQDSKIMRTLPSRAANGLLAKITGLKLHDSGCSLKLYRAKALKSISLYSDRHRFIPFLLHLKGFRITETVVGHRSRHAGSTKYGFSRTLKVFLDLIAFTLFARFRETPRFYFFAAAVPFLVGTTFFTLSAASQFSGKMGSQGTVTFVGASVLCAYGLFFMISCGLLAEWMTNYSKRQVD